MSLDFIKDNLTTTQKQVAAACTAAGRNISEVTLLPVTKQQPIEKLHSLYAIGERLFGENRVQDLNHKAALLPKDIQWHMIGAIQSNKARAVVQNASCIHSVDSMKLLERLNRVALEEEKCPAIFLQVNLTGEKSKGGFTEAELAEALEKAANSPGLNLSGLMTMGALVGNDEETRAVFRHLKNLRDSYSADYPQLKELSMGMSGDFSLAILEGATYVRVGSLILGARQY